MKKKVVAGLLTVAMVAAMVTGCGSSGGSSESSSGDSVKESYTIGISQFAEHGSLDNCREGFLEGLAEEGIVEDENLKVEYKNAAADMGTAGQISDSFVSDKVDLICAIATPTAQSAYNAAMDTEIPVIYTAVTDPVAAELADEDGTPVGEVTGTSDKLPVEEQLKMIREMLPDAKKLGIMYTTSEANSVSAIAEYKELVGEYGFELVEKGITATADVPLAADDLLSEVDCITNLTDNTVVASLPTILEKANEKKIPVFGSEIEQVKIGCLAAEGIDYIALGKQTGKMAAQVLKGEKKASELNFELITEPGFYVNNKVAENLGITVPEELAADAVESFDEITEE
ncbi:ABC transporter substrate-binding protein [Bariatricus sp. SGI.154]|uniref:ABC transporter substrate-binding protein n=1 Tax=Bariatricus sp. SGI.154 TaxID=3420549 RepID=UPI003D07D1DD